MYTRHVLVCHGTKRLPAEELVQKARNHVRMMTGNPHFPSPTPSLAEVSDACDELDIAARLYAFNRGRVELSNRNTAREQLRRLVIMLAGHVLFRCNDDRSIVLSAGFETKRKRSPSQALTAPGNMRAERTRVHGSVALRWGGVRHSRMYRIWYCTGDPVDPEGWQILTQTSRNYHTAEGLERFTTYGFRVDAFGALGWSPLSQFACATAA